MRGRTVAPLYRRVPAGLHRAALDLHRDRVSDARSAAMDGAATAPQLVAYRPFDDRWSEFSDLTMDYPRRELLDHSWSRKRHAVSAARYDWRHAFVADKPANDCVISNRSREANQVFPLSRFVAHARQENLPPTSAPSLTLVTSTTTRPPHLLLAGAARRG